MPDKTVSTRVPDDLRMKAKIKAAKADKSIAQVLRELLERWVQNGNGGEEKAEKSDV